ncbi:hypothetical protein [Neobacillus sp. LXY-1]|uniref:hypothetical protein n=1 Tax=Neobacillus sp. LXY-1 TaxID=3379133 RepID=UPI003EE2F847
MEEKVVSMLDEENIFERGPKLMFLEKHESAAVEEFTWFDEIGNFVDSEQPQIKIEVAKVNRYIIEVSRKNEIVVPKFIHWLLENNDKIYCIKDCRNYVASLSNIQKILFERDQQKSKWVNLPNYNHIYYKHFKNLEDAEIFFYSFLIISKKDLDSNNLMNLFMEFKLDTSRFPNLSFPRILPKNKDLIIGEVSWGESYFKPGTTEEPVVLVCYTARKL